MMSAPLEHDPENACPGLDPIGANIRRNGRVNDLSFETPLAIAVAIARPAGAPQDEVYRSDPHGEERREATRLEPQDLGGSLMLAPMGSSPGSSPGQAIAGTCARRADGRP